MQKVNFAYLLRYIYLYSHKNMPDAKFEFAVAFLVLEI